MKTSFLSSEHCRLEPMEKDRLTKLVDKIFAWVNDPEITYFLFTGQKPKTKKQILNEFEQLLAGETNLLFVVCDKKTNDVIGYVGLFDIHSTAKKAEFRILIGEKKYWGKGYGTEVTELVTFYGFDRLNLNRIYLGFTSAHTAAKKTYERAGYTYEGTLKQDLYRNSTYYDTIRMALLRDSYYKTYYVKHRTRFFTK